MTQEDKSLKAPNLDLQQSLSAWLKETKRMTKEVRK